MREIKKEITISAPVTKVWEHLTSSSKIAGWFFPNDFEPNVGKKFTLRSEGQCGNIACEVKEVLPLKKLAYTFRSVAMKIDTLVTFTLEELGPATKLTLVHSGLDKLEPGQEDMLDQFEQGWGSLFLQNLKTALEKK
jgi:uncharacterized protein YndB with AHSA1/START domain